MGFRRVYCHFECDSPSKGSMSNANAMGLSSRPFKSWSLCQSNHQLCQYLSETHTQPPNNWIRIPLAYLLHVIGAHTFKYGSIKDSGTVPSAP
ncbi:hypothetical protein TNCT_192861 [Trichonephila clavata]|uniref:Uncharacterized protein n=1 Tax=Trichonephila clavata TaxID=2740835 RepID=A0A8X6GVJ5_TRICU|nr:hypothetical protein TNCT_192861 [Trichonephila clavata]